MKCTAVFSRVGEVAEGLRRAAGWRRALYAFAFGSVMALAMPPFDVFPLLWVCLPALVLLLQGCRNKRQAFATGWSFAFGFLAFSLYWIAASMFVDLRHFWWAVPMSVAGLPAVFGLYNGLVAMIAWRLGVKGVVGAAIFGMMWFVGDVLRGNAFSGFPWNLVGYAWSGVLPVLQLTSVTGIYGLSLLTCIAAALPAALIERTKAARLASVAGVGLFVVIAIGGAARLLSTPVAETPGVRLRLVQPDIDEARKLKGLAHDDDFYATLALTTAPAAKPVTHYIWPETTMPNMLADGNDPLRLAAQRIPAAASLITGVIRGENDRSGHRYYNSLIVMDGLGRLVGAYDKTHLVPFGEYMPMRKYIPLPAVAADMGDFTPGDGVRSLRVLGLPPFSPLICYEAIFPGHVVDAADRPDFILNVTNDAWYGQTIGPYQHFAIVRVRAIEEGLPLVRAANTGISGVVDALGRVQARLGLGKKGYLDSDLPVALAPTLFAQWGEGPVRGLFLLFAVILYWLRRKNVEK